MLNKNDRKIIYSNFFIKHNLAMYKCDGYNCRANATCTSKSIKSKSFIKRTLIIIWFKSTPRLVFLMIVLRLSSSKEFWFYRFLTDSLALASSRDIVLFAYKDYLIFLLVVIKFYKNSIKFINIYWNLSNYCFIRINFLH